MIKIGDVRRAFALHQDWIVSIDIDVDVEVRINNGDVVHFENAGNLPIFGLRFWPDRRTIDVLIRNGVTLPRPGEAVYVVE